MYKFSALFAILLSSTAAHAAPSVALSGECGGTVTITVTLDAEGDYRMVWGDPGVDTVPMGGCAGTEVGVLGPASPMRTAIGGTDVLDLSTAAGRCAQSVQVIDLATCEVSSVESLAALPGVGYSEGYDDGYGVGLGECDPLAGYGVGFDDGFMGGFDLGFEAGLAECDPLAGYDLGHMDGLAECDPLAGYDDGYSVGFDDGALEGGVPDNCFESAFCQEMDLLADTGLPNANIGNVTYEECGSPDFSEGPWWAGLFAAPAVCDNPFRDDCADYYATFCPSEYEDICVMVQGLCGP